MISLLPPPASLVFCVIVSGGVIRLTLSLSTPAILSTLVDLDPDAVIKLILPLLISLGLSSVGRFVFL